MEAFNLLSAELAGRQLIDASAGTGKTYTIAGLVLRLLLEQELSIRRILIVTYTEAACEDLRDRIRSMIRDAIAAFAREGLRRDFIGQLVKRQPDRQQAVRILNEALEDFDEAGIFTIHGFCRRMLWENSIETGSMFEPEILANQREIEREIVEDFWRSHFYTASDLFAEYIGQRLSINDLQAFVARHATPVDPVITPALDPEETGAAAARGEHAFLHAYKEVCRQWPRARPEVEDILLNDPGLKRVKYNRARIPQWIDDMETLTALDFPPPAAGGIYAKFSAAEIAGAVRKGHLPPQHPFFVLCDALQNAENAMREAFNAHLTALKVKLLKSAGDELRKRKKKRNILSFDDLLLNLYHALKGANGRALASAIRNRFPAALIDEFQDTDPVQYAIFDAVYRGPTGLLFMIGDPKQAIYGFRGADIFTYMRAAAKAPAHYTLKTNWRTTPALIRAVNTLFAGVRAPFIFNEIPFVPVAPPNTAEQHDLIIDGRRDAPFRLWVLRRKVEGGTNGFLSRERAAAWILKAMAAEIVRLLDAGGRRRALLAGRPLAPGDMAILVRTNREARMVHEFLKACGVGTVLHGTESLFASPAALDMTRLLAGLAAPGDLRTVKAALCTAFIGINGPALNRLQEDERAWDEWLAKFHDYHSRWQQYGFVRMFRGFLDREGVRSRLLGLPDGERRLTDTLHLMEVLHQASIDKDLGITGLIRYLQERLDSGGDDYDKEEYQLRLESDAARIRIVTIHKAKGLEYPIVFCPFPWQGGGTPGGKKQEIAFHRRDGDRQPVLDLGSGEYDKHLQWARQEALAEELRILYVALTRAKCRCYLAWGPVNRVEDSGLAYLLHQPADAGTDCPPDLFDAAARRFKGLNDQEIWEDLETLSASSSGAIKLMPIVDRALPSYKAEDRAGISGLAGRKFSGKINSGWKIASFSTMAHGRRALSAEQPDRDSAFDVEARDQAGECSSYASILDFPAGSKPGTFMHDLLENLDFTNQDHKSRAALIQDKLLLHGFDSAWLDTLNAMLADLLAAPLDPRIPALTLSRITPGQRLNELEFYFPLARLTITGLTHLFSRHRKKILPSPAGRHADLAPLEGFMKGFIDLVFEFEGRYFLVDWKSNFLGRGADDYHRLRLERIMLDESYTLQYHIYTVALHRYLAMRLRDYRYERDFGGVYYVFLRGLGRDRGPDYGIFRDRPSAPLVAELEALLTGAGDL